MRKAIGALTHYSWWSSMVHTVTWVQLGLFVNSFPNHSSFTSLPHSIQHTTAVATTTSYRFSSSVLSAFTTSTATSTTTRSTSVVVGPRLAIDESYPGLKRVSSNPDIFVIENFLSSAACADIMQQAQAKGTLAQSPVAYAGWTQDFQDLTELAIKGPVSWLALIGAWFQVKDNTSGSDGDLTSNPTIQLVVHALQNFGVLLVVTIAAIAAFTKSRADGLQRLRTSTSTTLDDLSNPTSGTTEFVQRAALLFDSGSSSSIGTPTTISDQAALFEAPTVIRYEPGQVLAPHFDANRSAATEDANRGGQTLATLIVYLNNVPRGGLTRFGKVPAAAAEAGRGGGQPQQDDSSTSLERMSQDPNLTIQPKLGDALLFFPADAAGRFDERTEHEGCPAVDEKWIARIWRHSNRVPPPFGLSDATLSQL
jgi:general stress protein YciG